MRGGVVRLDADGNHVTRLSARTDLSPRRLYRLPTIREWKDAYRRDADAPALRDVDPSFPPRGADTGSVKDAWLPNAARACAPMPVKLKPANALGLHDMAGNVFEMVAERAYPDVKPLWFNTEYGFLAESHDTPPPCSADDPAATVPLLLGQPFTPGLLEDELWGSHFPKMPNAGFRLAADAP